MHAESSGLVFDVVEPGEDIDLEEDFARFLIRAGRAKSIITDKAVEEAKQDKMIHKAGRIKCG